MSSRSIGDLINNRVWLCACLALAAAALPAGCGGGSSVSTSGEVTAPASVSTTTSTMAGETTPDDLYQSCVGALEGSVPEKRAENACAQVRDAFQQCTTAASNAPEGSARDTALKSCQQAADRATAQLQSSP